MKVNLKNPGSSCLSITRTYDNRMTERVKTENSENVYCVVGLLRAKFCWGDCFFFHFILLKVPYLLWSNIADRSSSKT